MEEAAKKKSGRPLKQADNLKSRVTRHTADPPKEEVTEVEKKQQYKKHIPELY